MSATMLVRRKNTMLSRREIVSALAGMALLPHLPSRSAHAQVERQPSSRVGGQRKPMRLKVSKNRRFLAYEDGKPFFYLGDTAWELFHRLNREEADIYLTMRAQQGFTVIQAVAL